MSCYSRNFNPKVACAMTLLASSIALAQVAESTYRPGIDFSKYRTYQWLTTRPHPDQIVDSEIKRSVESQLAGKGLTKTDSTPDLTIDYHVAVSQSERWSQFRYNEIETLNPTIVTVYAGTLGVDISDAALKQVVWSGRVKKAIDPDNPPPEKRRNLDSAVKQLLKNFPPKQRR